MVARRDPVLAAGFCSVVDRLPPGLADYDFIDCEEGERIRLPVSVYPFLLVVKCVSDELRCSLRRALLRQRDRHGEGQGRARFAKSGVIFSLYPSDRVFESTPNVAVDQENAAPSRTV